MALNRPLLVVFATAVLILTGYQVMPRTTVPSLGELEHRGHRYAVRDLTSQAYRDASNDPFVRNFNPETVLSRGDASPDSRAALMCGDAFEARR
jgi:hypothetical protein